MAKHFQGKIPLLKSTMQVVAIPHSLSMVTANGCAGVTTVTDYIFIEDITPYIVADVTGGCNPLDVQFSDTSTAPNPLNPITNWEWDFGNGQTFSGQSPPIQTYKWAL